LGTLGQSIWLDYIRRDLIASGGLRRLIEKDGLRGMTSNSSIFEKAIADSHDYDEDFLPRGSYRLGSNGYEPDTWGRLKPTISLRAIDGWHNPKPEEAIG